MDEQIKVSVLCLAYNHERFIEKTLEGFVMQKTNFKYEVLVHDDASTDNTANIIKKYEDKYPNIIKPIYQSENQHSKGVMINKDILTKKAKGKYIALCEGDDFWINENKLQKQFDYMEENAECMLCTHNTLKHDLLSGKEIKFNKWLNIHELNDKEIFSGWNVHTSSYFYRKELIILDEYDRFWFGDYIKLCSAYLQGKVVCLPEIMSVYNFNNKDGVTYLKKNSGLENQIKKVKMKIEFLNMFNANTGFKYDSAINCEINKIEIECLTDQLDYHIEKKDKNGYKEIKNKLLKHKFIKTYFYSLGKRGKVYFVLKLRLLFIYNFFRKVRK